MKQKAELTDIQKNLIGGLNLLDMEKDNKIMVMLMLKEVNQQLQMANWLYQNFKKEIMPKQEDVMDKAQEIMQTS